MANDSYVSINGKTVLEGLPAIVAIIALFVGVFLLGFLTGMQS